MGSLPTSDLVKSVYKLLTDCCYRAEVAELDVSVIVECRLLLSPGFRASKASFVATEDFWFVAPEQ